MTLVGINKRVSTVSKKKGEKEAEKKEAKKEGKKRKCS